MPSYTPGSGVYISTATTTVVSAHSGTLTTVTVVGGTAGTITIYDNASAASGTIIAAFDSTNAIATYTFNRSVANGITVVTSQATKLHVGFYTG